MADVQGGIAGGYLNKRQMKALMAMVDKKGVSRAQVVKELIVRTLVSEGYLGEIEITMLEGKQELLREQPHGNASETLRERSARALQPEGETEVEKPVRRRRRMAR